MISSRSITVVFQGKLPPAGSPAHYALERNIVRLRSLLPGAPIMLGTWDGATVSKAFGFDRVAFSSDPGALPSFKKNAPRVENNINRQLAGMRDVLREVETPYVLKLRLDSEVSHVGFLACYSRYGRNPDGRERIAVGGFFTLDPRMFERMPFHVSDWFSFGPAVQMRQLWGAAFMTLDDATWYDRHPHAAHSTWFERCYRTRFAIEQYIAARYAAKLGYLTPQFHNDVHAEVLVSHDRFMQREMLVLDQAQSGLASSRYPMAPRSSLQYFNCLGFLDWYLLDASKGVVPKTDPAVHAMALVRQRRKDLMRRASILTNPLMPLIRQRWVKACVSRVLRMALQLA